MKRFALDILIFVAVVTVVLGAACVALPGTRAKNSMLAQQIWIERTLQETPGGRIIFVGGSGCGCGLCSEDIAKAFGRNVINTGLHAGLGLIYQMKAVAHGVKAGDCVIVVPEYANFNGTSCYGDLELLSMVLDVVPSDRSLLDWEHWFYLVRFVPAYATSKMVGLLKKKTAFKPRKSQYGDAGWEPPDPNARQFFPPSPELSSDAYADDVIRHIKDFKQFCESRGARMLIFPPAFQRISFEHQADYIRRASCGLEMAGIPFVVEPDKFALSDDLFYDTPYHLNLNG